MMCICGEHGTHLTKAEWNTITERCFGYTATGGRQASEQIQQSKNGFFAKKSTAVAMLSFVRIIDTSVCILRNLHHMVHKPHSQLCSL